MKKVLFATTAAGAMALGGMASAQGISLFGDARLGLGWNVLQNGDIVPDQVTERPPGTDEMSEDELRAISRVRFGVRMTGETPTGITFGATIRADNAGSGSAGGAAGMAGNVFASGAFGTLTYGDVASAHQQHTGDLPELGLTGLGFFNEIQYLGNRRHAVQAIVVDPDGIETDIGTRSQRPTVRYDYDFAGLGFSISTDRDLNDIGVGTSFSGDFAGGSFTVGAGWYDDDIDEQFSASIGGTFAGVGGNVIYTRIRGGGDEFLGAGLTTTFADIGFDAYYLRALRDSSDFVDGDDAFGAGASFDLGGGASLRGGVVHSFESTTAADFGISMAF